MPSLTSLGISDCYSNYFASSKNAPDDAFYDPFPARKIYNPQKHKDGLTTDWPTDRVSFANGPYFKNAAVTRACKTQQLRGVTVVQLDKLASTGTQYAEELHSTGVEYTFLTCGIAFQGHHGQVATFKSKMINYTVYIRVLYGKPEWIGQPLKARFKTLRAPKIPKKAKKSKKRKTQKRKTQKRKTQKRTTQKRKTQKRKRTLADNLNRFRKSRRRRVR
jgi:hypothetical protein